jgi:hypothetical protein
MRCFESGMNVPVLDGFDQRIWVEGELQAVWCNNNRKFRIGY